MGPYQISRAYYNDAVQNDPSLRDGGKSYENVMGQGSKEYSERVIQAYMNRYATERRLDHPVTDEDIARIHNGGPNGFRRNDGNTLKYWIKVQYNYERGIDDEDYEYYSSGSGDEIW